MHCHSTVLSWNSAFMRRTMQRGCVGGLAMCNLRKVQVSGKRLMRATCEYGPLFRAIKQFLRTHGIMFLLFSIGPDIEQGERKIEGKKIGTGGGENANRESSYRRTDGLYRENGRANGNGNFIDKIVVAVRYTKRFVIVTDRSPRKPRFLESTLISLQLKRLFILKTFVLLKIIKIICKQFY
ncbi:hypothetical protein ALC57_00418 [Trachymyrmex cornetzi]|uniref:Uncharacterized protein n=1 Tax=Trachymyrmex cornetzi TaxID=471704 RepID=A0A151JRV7_9HYME|nr:hypothetical protein ALC57_00418 [Trachymyrmex cornetzi]